MFRRLVNVMRDPETALQCVALGFTRCAAGRDGTLPIQEWRASAGQIKRRLLVIAKETTGKQALRFDPEAFFFDFGSDEDRTQQELRRFVTIVRRFRQLPGDWMHIPGKWVEKRYYVERSDIVCWVPLPLVEDRNIAPVVIGPAVSTAAGMAVGVGLTVFLAPVALPALAVAAIVGITGAVGGVSAVIPAILLGGRECTLCQVTRTVVTKTQQMVHLFDGREIAVEDWRELSRKNESKTFPITDILEKRGETWITRAEFSQEVQDFIHNV
jgi:hypothetical protein